MSFLPADERGTFRLRNLCLVLRLSDGSEISTATDPQEYLTRQGENGAAEPIHAHFDLPAD